MQIQEVALIVSQMGWANVLGQTAGVASVAYSVGQFFLAMVSLGSGFDAEAASFRYSPTPGHTVGASVGMLALMGIICSLSSKWLSHLIVWFAPVGIIASVAISIAMLVLTENKNSASYVFTNFVDGSGWGNKGFSFLLGFLSVVWTMTGKLFLHSWKMCEAGANASHGQTTMQWLISPRRLATRLFEVQSPLERRSSYQEHSDFCSTSHLASASATEPQHWNRPRDTPSHRLCTTPRVEQEAWPCSSGFSSFNFSQAHRPCCQTLARPLPLLETMPCHFPGMLLRPYQSATF